jgi:hypothetical protein
MAISQLPRRDGNDGLEQASMLLFDMIRKEVEPTAERLAAGEAEYASWMDALREAAATGKERA